MIMSPGGGSETLWEACGCMVHRCGECPAQHFFFPFLYISVFVPVFLWSTGMLSALQHSFFSFFCICICISVCICVCFLFVFLSVFSILICICFCLYLYLYGPLVWWMPNQHSLLPFFFSSDPSFLWYYDHCVIIWWSLLSYYDHCVIIWWSSTKVWWVPKILYCLPSLFFLLNFRTFSSHLWWSCFNLLIR